MVTYIYIIYGYVIFNLSVQLLERRRGARIADTAENIECLCHFMTTVGEKLDTHKAKVT